MNKERWIAAGVTALVAMAIFIILFKGSLTFERRLMAASSIPEIGQEEEETFLIPELQMPGEEESESDAQAAPEAQGTPEVVKEPEPVVTPVVKGENPKPSPPKDKRVTQKRESEVKASEPTATDKERRKVQAAAAAAFSPDNGRPEGRNNSSGAGGTSTGVAANVYGRDFISCPAPKVSLRNKTVVKVKVTVAADGHVTSATALWGGNASLRAKCEQAALKARWKEKSGSPVATGTITFTITPK